LEALLVNCQPGLPQRKEKRDKAALSLKREKEVLWQD